MPRLDREWLKSLGVSCVCDLGTRGARAPKKLSVKKRAEIAGKAARALGESADEASGGGEMIGARRLWTTACLTFVLSVVSVGCATRQVVQEDSANHRREVEASAYTLEGCQEKMDEMAGGHVQMTGHEQAVLVSVLNLGITPPYQCQGIIADTKQ